MPIAVPDVEYESLYSSLLRQLGVIIAHLPNELYPICINDRAGAIRAANSPFCNPAGFSDCASGRLAFREAVHFDVFASFGRTRAGSRIA